MSWMDSWSRPGKHATTPPPLYLTSPDEVKYCKSCGRVIGSRKTLQGNKVVKYCSDACRKKRISHIDKRIDGVILALLQGDEDSGIERTNAKSRTRKGDRRTMITCDEIEDIMFDRHAQKQPDRAEGYPESDGEQELQHVSDNEQDVTSTKPLDERSETEKRVDGQKRANEREMVRKAARRAVVFGLVVDAKDPRHEPFISLEQQDDGEKVPKRKCEAIMSGQVVEPSFAKGNWSIRWRES